MGWQAPGAPRAGLPPSPSTWRFRSLYAYARPWPTPVHPTMATPLASDPLVEWPAAAGSLTVAQQARPVAPAAPSSSTRSGVACDHMLEERYARHGCRDVQPGGIQLRPSSSDHLPRSRSTAGGAPAVRT